MFGLKRIHLLLGRGEENVQPRPLLDLMFKRAEPPSLYETVTFGCFALYSLAFHRARP